MHDGVRRRNVKKCGCEKKYEPQIESKSRSRRVLEALVSRRNAIPASWKTPAISRKIEAGVNPPVSWITGPITNALTRTRREYDDEAGRTVRARCDDAIPCRRTARRQKNAWTANGRTGLSREVPRKISSTSGVGKNPSKPSRNGSKISNARTPSNKIIRKAARFSSEMQTEIRRRNGDNKGKMRIKSRRKENLSNCSIFITRISVSSRFKEILFPRWAFLTKIVKANTSYLFWERDSLNAEA